MNPDSAEYVAPDMKRLSVFCSREFRQIPHVRSHEGWMRYAKKTLLLSPYANGTCVTQALPAADRENAEVRTNALRRK